MNEVRNEVCFDQVGDGRILVYVPLSDNCTNAAYRGRVRHVGLIERHAGKWFWYTHDDSDAGMCKTLTAAKSILASRA